MTDKNLIAKFEKPKRPRRPGLASVWLEGDAADMADRFNAKFGSSDGELMAAAWTLFSAAVEHALAGGTIQFIGGRADGLEVPVLEIIKNFVMQRRTTGEINSSS